MRKRSFLLYFITIFMSYACDFGLENTFKGLFDTRYYKFTTTDYSFLLPNYKEENKITEFVNQHNDIVRLQNSYYSITKETDGGLLSDSKRYKHDKLWIELALIDKGGNCATLSIQISKTDNNTLFQTVSIPSYSKPSCSGSTFYFNIPDALEVPKTNLNINGKTYNDVLVFEASGAITKHYTLYKDSKIHKVYYDLKEGIIGFDDTTNNLQFRIKE